MDLRSPLGRARGLGSAKTGVHHWWMQRVTAIALIGLCVWFVYTVLKSVHGGGSILDNLANPCTTVLMILFLGTALYHGALGMRVIIEDYVHCKCGRPFLIIFTNFAAIITGASVTVALVHYHVNNYDASKRSYDKKGHERLVLNELDLFSYKTEE